MIQGTKLQAADQNVDFAIQYKSLSIFAGSVAWICLVVHSIILTVIDRLVKISRASV